MAKKTRAKKTKQSTRSRRSRPARATLSDPHVDMSVAGHVREGLAEFISLIDGLFKNQSGVYWYRGHTCKQYLLQASALRAAKVEDQQRALDKLSEFVRLAQLKLANPPSADDTLHWMQIAQHYGLPTRLMDWSTNPAVALYFACEDRHGEDGYVYLFNPYDLNQKVTGANPRLLDAVKDRELLAKYQSLTATPDENRGEPNLSVSLILNNDRVYAQRGAFTLHGNRYPHLGPKQAPSLSRIRISASAKPLILRQLHTIGVDRLSLYPEIEHVCRHLKES